MDLPNTLPTDLETADNEQLINLVQLHTILFDSASHTNINRVAKESAWQEIASEMGKMVLWCETQWKKLKAAYRRKKNQLIGKSGQAKLRIESWAHFAAMQFLDDHIAERITSGNMGVDSEFSLESQNSTPHPSPSDQSADVSVSLDSGISETAVNVAAGSCEPKRKRCKPTDKVDEEIIKFLNKPKKDADSHDHFCKGVAEQLRNMRNNNPVWPELRYQKYCTTSSLGTSFKLK